MSGVLGVSVGRSVVRALLVERGAVAWAGSAPYEGSGDLAEVMARLTAEAERPVRRARVALERDVVQLRTVIPAPPLQAEAARRYVALEAPRLFRKDGTALVTDARIVRAGANERVLWTAAASEPLVRAVLEGCAGAGLRVEAIGPAAEVLPCAVVGPADTLAFPNGTATEVLEVGREGTWRSRRTAGADAPAPAWVAPLAALGEEAKAFAAAYGAAKRAPRLLLVPPEARAARGRAARRRLWSVTAAAAGLWLAAGAIGAARVVASARASGRELVRLGPAVDSALAVRRDLRAASAMLDLVAQAERGRSRHLALLAQLAQALGDSVFIVALRLAPDGTLRLAGYAPVAARVLADLERVPALRDAKFEGPVTREAPPGRGELDRFAIVARLEGSR